MLRLLDTFDTFLEARDAVEQYGIKTNKVFVNLEERNIFRKSIRCMRSLNTGNLYWRLQWICHLRC